MATKLFNIK